VRVLYFAVAWMLAAGHTYAQRTYDVSDTVIRSSHTRSTYYLQSERHPHSHESFLEKADRSRPVVLHAHGCHGLGGYDQQLAFFYRSLGFHVVLTNFLTRGDAESSCPSVNASRTGHPETGNPHRVNARRLELEHHIDWLKGSGFADIVVTGHSEGGKVVQGFKRPVRGVVIHSMDCKERHLWDPHPDNRYLVLYSPKDPWITGIGSYPTRPCRHLFNQSKVREPGSSVDSHGPLDDPAWRDEIRQFLSDVSRSPD